MHWLLREGGVSDIAQEVGALESLYRDVRSDPKDDVTFHLKFWILSVKLMHHLVASR
jgi:hypothetical protein